MQTTDIGNKEDGKIWQRKPSPTTVKGIMVNIIRSIPAYQTKTVRFLQVAFDTTGDAFLTGDHLGNLYVFDLSSNRFRLVQKTGQACTALAFTLRRTSEYLVALADYSIKCFDKDTKHLVSWMRGHDCVVSSVSVQSSGRYAITTSSDTAQLWDLDTFQRMRRLNIRQSVTIQKVFFLPRSNIILSCFSDDSIFAWDSDTLRCKYKLQAPEEGRLHYKAFAVTHDGRVLVAGGRSNLLHVWCLKNQQLLKVVQMPPKVCTVRQVEFMMDVFTAGFSQVLGVLSQDGVMRFIDIHTCKLAFAIGSSDNGIASTSVSPTGRHIVAVMENGSLNIYSVEALVPEDNKSPVPVMKVTKVTTRKVDESIFRRKSLHNLHKSAKTSGRKLQTRGLNHPADTTPEDKENEFPDELNRKRLHTLLKAYSEYPAKYRMFIWRSLLSLPENYSAFSSLTDKGPHPAFLTLHQRYPIKSPKLQRVLRRLLSALAHWSAIFGEADYLPLVVFPFVKLFQNNAFVCFEVVATVIVNWCQHWFEYFPNPPLNVLNVVENVLAHHDKQLLQHLVNCGITSQAYAWPLLETFFSEVLTRDEWLKLFDNVFSSHPCFLLLAVVSYLMCSRRPLLQCAPREDFEYFFHHRNNLDVGAMIKKTYELMAKTPEEIHPRSFLDDFEPLSKDQYPVFNKYPTFAVEYQSRERERIRQQELDYLRERQEVQELRLDAVRRKAEDQAWYTQQELLREAEDQRRRVLQQEESQLAEQRVRLAALKRELKVKELHLVDAARRRFLKHQKEQKQLELRRLDDEIQRKVALRERETAAALQDAEVKQMELEAQRNLFEQRLAQEHDRAVQEIRAETDGHLHRAEMNQSAILRMLQTDTDPTWQTKKNLEESLAQAEQLCTEADWRAEALQRVREDQALQQQQHKQLSERLREIQTQEEQLLQTMQELEGIQWEEVQEKSRDQHWEEDEEANLSDKTQSRQKPVSVSVPSRNRCLNNLSLSPISSHSAPFSLDRGRGELDSKERELMKDIRDLRVKLASRSRSVV